MVTYAKGCAGRRRERLIHQFHLGEEMHHKIFLCHHQQLRTILPKRTVEVTVRKKED